MFRLLKIHLGETVSRHNHFLSDDGSRGRAFGRMSIKPLKGVLQGKPCFSKAAGSQELFAFFQT
ncbi:hypothetical protein [Geobacter metallireducens]|uniref:hypothetical protein n=1 Tax=Geobacter metallireducens TaxID=28232 RepID=UPI001EE3EA32|nr:hypothetical protein [Geobacter metallireducens]